ncbi:MAG: Fe-S metabolism protein SufE [Candidatus Amoebophilus sp. 36-38]|nr:MAG: Fe-S metabolism protein SufE [Candidatus Amoebophilus sp. 36-38]
MLDNSVQSTQAIQEQIIEEFKFLEGDREAMLHYLIEIGEKLPPLAEVHKIEQNKIQGCMSSVWLVCRKEGERLFFEADSNTAITKGLISLLLRVLSGQTIQTILATNLYFVEEIGMQQLIGSQRSSGFASMIKQIETLANTYQLREPI